MSNDTADGLLKLVRGIEGLIHELTDGGSGVQLSHNTEATILDACTELHDAINHEKVEP